jgi:energy-coupling factor transporter ATP-binding protein EcfA2
VPEFKLLRVPNIFGYINETYKDNLYVYRSYESSRFSEEITNAKGIKLEFIRCEQAHIDAVITYYKNKHPKVLPAIKNRTANQEKLEELEQSKQETEAKLARTNLTELIREYIIANCNDKQPSANDRIDDKLKTVDNSISERINALTTENLMDEILQLHATCCSSYAPELDVPKTRYIIDELQFNNIMVYGTDNCVNLTGISPGSLIGICAKNSHGKSTLLSSLMFGIYGEVERGTIKSMIRMNRPACDLLTRIKSNIYIHSGASDKVSSLPTYLRSEPVSYNIYRYRKNDTPVSLPALHDQYGVPRQLSSQEYMKLQEYQSPKTLIDGIPNKATVDRLYYNAYVFTEGKSTIDPYITKLVGNFDIVNYTAVCTQRSSYDILRESGVEQKKILERIFKLNVIDKLKDAASKCFDTAMTEYTYLREPCPETIAMLSNRILKAEEDNKSLLEHVGKAEAALKIYTDRKDKLLSDRPVIDPKLLDPSYITSLKAKLDSFGGKEYASLSSDDIRAQMLEIENKRIQINLSVSPKLSVIYKNKSPLYDMANKQHLRSIHDNHMRDINKFIESHKQQWTTEHFDDVAKINDNFNDLQEALNKLYTTKIRPLTSTDKLTDEVRRLKSKNNPSYNPSCECCSRNRKIFGESALDTINELESQIASIKADNQRYQEANDNRELNINKTTKIIDKCKAYQSWLAADALLDDIITNIEIDSQLIDLIEIYTEVTENESVIKEYNKCVSQIDLVETYKSISEEINKVNQTITDLSRNILTWRTNIETLLREDKLTRHKLDERTKYEDMLYVRYKNKRIAEIYKGCFNNRSGIQVKLLAEKLPLLNQTANDFLHMLDVDYEIYIGIDTNDTVDINLRKRGSVEQVKLCGGYQYDLVNLVVRISLWTLYEGPLPNFLIFDESFSHADQNNLHKLIEFLRSFKSSSTVPQFILINSHNIDLINNLDYTIHIEHNDTGRISRVNNITANKPPLVSDINEYTPLGTIQVKESDTLAANQTLNPAYAVIKYDPINPTKALCLACGKEINKSRVESHLTTKTHTANVSRAASRAQYILTSTVVKSK